MFIYVIALVVLAVTAYFLIRRKKTVNYVAPALSTEPVADFVVIPSSDAPEVEVPPSFPAYDPEPPPATVVVPSTVVTPKPKRKAKPKPPTAQE